MAANLPDFNTLLQAGIDPRTHLPVKFANGEKDTKFKDAIRKGLRIIDEQNAINRYVWYNLPSGLDGQLLERVLYYRGQGMFFYMETDGNFYFLPYALDGTIDVYGRFKGVTPLPFNGTTEDKKEKAWITGLIRTPVYDLIDVTENDFLNSCVLLTDYSKQISQTNIPRQILHDPIIEAMSEALPFARTNLIANCGVDGWRVNNEDEQQNVELASKSLEDAAIKGKPWIPIVGAVDFQAISNGGTANTDAYLQYMQALDNFRLSQLGLHNGGIFEKGNEYVNTTTASTIQANVGQIYQDGLTNRQRFCDFVNNIWGLGISVEPSETVLNSDYDMDGDIDDDFDQSGVPGEQKETEEGE